MDAAFSLITYLFQKKISLFLIVTFLRHIKGSATTEEQLLKDYRADGDLKVLGELYEPYMDLVHAVCMKYLKETEKARDAVMNIFEELIVKLRKHEVTNFKSWLYQLSRNHCLMLLRSPRELKTVEWENPVMQNGSFPHPDDETDKKELALTGMEDCLGKLAYEQERMVRLFYLESKTYHEIVDITGVEWNQVRSNIQNGRRNLKLCMEKKFDPQTLEIKTGDGRG